MIKSEHNVLKAFGTSDAKMLIPNYWNWLESVCCFVNFW